MKKLGEADTGGVLVELSAREYELLTKLYQAWRGGPISLLDGGRYDADIGAALAAVYRYSVSAAEANRLRAMAEEMVKLLRGEEASDGK